MSELQIFKHEEFGTVRTVTIADEPWFVGKDVATVLGYAKPLNALSQHVDIDDSLKQGLTDSVGRVQETIVINESGLYSLILSSKIPSAKKFKKWVTSEVIPSIRKSGGYIAGQEQMSESELMAKALLVAQKQIENRDKEIERMKPKEIFADAVSCSETSILVRDLAKLIRQNGVDIGEKRLYKWLRDNGYICKGTTEPTQRAMELGLFERIVRTIERGDGLPVEKITTKVTGKGQVYFINKFLSHGGE